MTRASMLAVLLLQSSPLMGASADACSALLYQPSACASALINSSLSTVTGPIVVWGDKAADLCYLGCLVCSSAWFLAWQVPQLGAADAFCSLAGLGQPAPAGPPASADEVVGNATAALLNVSALQGWTWLDDAGDVEENVTQAVAALLAGMPRRDLQLLASDTSLFVDFLLEHTRYALRTRAWSSAFNVTWPLFVEAVLPYAIIDEKRDLWFRWRPRFARLFRDVTDGAATITDAMHALAAALPRAASMGALAITDNGELEVVPGPPMTWHSSVSPAYISPETVAAFGGSCTGTGVVLVAAARAVGIPARLAGCGESGSSGDDHHWAEYFDASSPGPFNDSWHTKEGTSAGNAGGPWDSPSGPMLGCLAGVVPYSAMDSLWAASWTSSTYMPLLWSNDSYSATWSFMGGLDRCGVYCTAWGCGAGNSMHYSQAQCSQFPDRR